MDNYDGLHKLALAVSELTPPRRKRPYIIFQNETALRAKVEEEVDEQVREAIQEYAQMKKRKGAPGRDILSKIQAFIAS
jgi:hypothetical protein